MQQVYDIVFTGRLRPGADPETVVDEFSKRLDIGPDTARAMLQAEQEIVVRPAVPSAEAYRFKEVLELLGMDVRLQALHDDPEGDEPVLELVPKGGADEADTPAAEPASISLNRTGVQCPKCGTHQPAARACTKCGLVFEKYYAHKANPGASSGQNVRVTHARAAARKSVAKRRNSALINAVLAIAVLVIVGGLGYVYYAGHQF